MVKKPTRTTTKRRTGRKAASTPAQTQTKQATVLGLLRRQNGATVAEIIAATDWQPHSVRDFFAGALKRRLKIDVISDKGEEGVRRYYVAPLKG